MAALAGPQLGPNTWESGPAGFVAQAGPGRCLALAGKPPWRRVGGQTASGTPAASPAASGDPVGRPSAAGARIALPTAVGADESRGGERHRPHRVHARRDRGGAVVQPRLQRDGDGGRAYRRRRRGAAGVRTGTAPVSGFRPTPAGPGRRPRRAAGLRPRRGVQLLRAGKQLQALLADHQRPFLGQEAGDQAHLAGRVRRRIPGKPDAIRVADVRLAVVQGELFGREHVFPRRPGIVLVAVCFIEGVDRQRSLDLDRLFGLFGVEHQPAAEAADRLRLVGRDRESCLSTSPPL